MDNKLDEILKQTKENSIGIDKKNEFIRSVKVISKKILTMLIVVSITVTLAACGNVKTIDIYPESNNGEVVQVEDVGYSNDLDLMKVAELRGEILTKVRVKFLNAGIKYRDSDGTVIVNDVETYKKLYNIIEEELIGYYCLLGQEESSKILQILGYEGWDDYLVQNGFINENNEPDIKMWENSVYEQLQIEYERRMEK